MFPILSQFPLAKSACISTFDVAAWHISGCWSLSSTGRDVTGRPVAQCTNTGSWSSYISAAELSASDIPAVTLHSSPVVAREVSSECCFGARDGPRPQSCRLIP